MPFVIFYTVMHLSSIFMREQEIFCHGPCDFLVCAVQKSMSRPFIVALQVHVNPSQSVLVLEGDDIESFNRAVQQVTYRNSLRFATPGVRPLKLTTSLRCKHTHTHVHAYKQTDSTRRLFFYMINKNKPFFIRDSDHSPKGRFNFPQENIAWSI